MDSAEPHALHASRQAASCQAASCQATSCQFTFARRWSHLAQPHVRALAWLIDSPDLLDRAAPAWAGKLVPAIAVTPALHAWFAQLDAAPGPLLAALGDKPYTRLGLYAEKLLAYFYNAQGLLVAHGLQVRASRNDTVGEFDFLISSQEAGEEGLEHIELATKFYLLAGNPASRLDALVGPNLADTLGAKMRKILGKQLALAGHPAAQAVLPGPVLHARALIKGWLFYPVDAEVAPMAGIAPDHCRGFWCTLADLRQGHHARAARWVLLPRLAWLAPYRLRDDTAVLDGAGLAGVLEATFRQQRAPVMVAALADDGAGAVVEQCRGFVVPDDWPARVPG